MQLLLGITLGIVLMKMIPSSSRDHITNILQEDTKHYMPPTLVIYPERIEVKWSEYQMTIPGGSREMAMSILSAIMRRRNISSSIGLSPEMMYIKY